MSCKQQLENLQTEIQEKKEEQIRFKERLKTLEEQEKEYKNKLKELGINKIEDLEKEIEILTEQIKAGFEKCKLQMK